MNIHSPLPPLPVDTTHPADMLGILKARISEYELQAEAARAQIVALGEGAHEGLLFRASVSIADRDTVDWKAIAAKFSPSRQLVTAHTTTKSVTTVRVASRNGK
jgi:hypothetical protein